MTLAVQVPSTTKVFTGPGEYTFSNFLAYSADTITAYHRSATGLEAKLTYGTDYTATLNVGTIGGHIDVTTSDYTGGFIIIGRELPFAQEVDLIGAGRFDPETLERALDEAAMRDQQLQASVDLFLSTSHWRTDWVTGTVYNTNDIVQFTDLSFYVCTEAHTSGTFATDLAAGKWTLIINVAFINQLTSEASSAAIEATTQAGIATTQASNASASATTASTQAGIATTQAGIATTGANTATTQAGIATTKAAEAAASALEAAGLVLVGERSDAIYPDYYVATAGQTAFTITHPTAKENILVFMNSRKLRITDDYTLNSDTAASVLTLTTAAAGGEELDIISINTYDLTGSAADMANLVSQATTQATNAASSATAAGNSATAAAGSASTASTQATNAANSASAAATSATNSANSATASAGSASTATAQATASANSATASANSATAAAGSATAADGSADAAAASALVAEGHADDAAVSATEAAAATSLLNKKIAILQNELLDRCMPAVAKILATTANLVDAFIYNTYDDYDGGAWTENAHTQSWYTEQLNTATRGSKREFPKVALIVAETNKVTIYDATETGCPMWMVCEATSAGTKHIRSASAIKAALMKNGVLCVATELGLSVINFLSDTSKAYTGSSQYNWPSTGSLIAYRNSAGTFTAISGSTGIVNTACNDVAMAQISRTENAYGLLDPVFAVATDGGVSVIDGPAGLETVVDSQYNQAASTCYFDEDGKLWFDRKGVNTQVLVSSDYSTDGFARYVYTDSIPAMLKNNVISKISKGVSAGSLGLTKLSEDTTTPANGMVAYITNAYNTGWLKGDIRRALICDAGESNLVSNGTFDSDTGWTASGGTLSVNSGRLRVTDDNADGSYPYGYQTIATVSGRKYTLTGYRYNGTASSTQIIVRDASISGTIIDTQSSSSEGAFSLTFTALSPTTFIGLRTANTTGLYSEFDNIIVQEVETLTNLVTNGTFDTDTGWTKGTGWTISGGVATGAAGSSSYLTQADKLVIGRRYSITFTVSSISAGTVKAVCGGGTLGTARSTAGTYIEILTCSGNDDFAFLKDSAFAGSIDNVIVTEVIEDRSVKASALTVNGSLTRSPVAPGAELQAISGFSASNFLSQAYSADLDVGTGDFYVCGWLKENPNSAAEDIIQRSYYSGGLSGSYIRIYIAASGVISLVISDDGDATRDQIVSSTTIDDSTYRFLVGQRVGNKLELWLNGAKAATDVSISNATGSLSNANATLRIGCSQDGLYRLTNGSIALLRIGAGYLSEAQIAKMYQDELPLFQGNAKCTIQGASSAISALAWNERYKKLLVGTSAGVTTFDGLVVDQDFYSSTRSIKALASAGKAVAEANTIDMRWDVDNQEFAAYSPKTMATPEGGLAVLMTNKTGAASVKGYIVSADTTVDNAVRLTPIGSPDCIGVCYEDGVADGAEMWVVVSGIADVYFSGSATRGHYARTGFTDDTGEVAGQAVSEAIPSPPLATDKHFAEIGHVLASRTGAGITKCVLHFN